MRHAKYTGSTSIAAFELPVRRVRIVVAHVAGLLAASACVLAVLAAATPGVSLAERAHVFDKSFAGTGAIAGSGEAGSLNLAATPGGQSPGSGLAVNQSTHDVYVADTGNRRVDEFTSAGMFVRAWGWGVSNGAGELQVCTTHCQVGLAGSSPGQFETLSYVAVDNDPESVSRGDVYVADTGNDIVTKFTASGALVTSWGTNGQLEGSPTETFDSGFAGLLITGIAVDGSGNLWVYNVHFRLFEFAETGTWIHTYEASTSASAGGGGIVFNEACKSECGMLAHDGFGRVQRFVPQLEPEPRYANTGPVTAGEPAAQGIGIDDANEDIYVVRSHSSVEDLPGWCVRFASPSGCLASQVFGEELTGGTGLAVDSGTGAVYAADAATDLISRFVVRIEASIEPPAPIHAHDVTLRGLVNPVGTEPISCRFEYSATEGRPARLRREEAEIAQWTKEEEEKKIDHEAFRQKGFAQAESRHVHEREEGEYSTSVPCSPESIGAGNSSVPVSATVEGLPGSTEFHFRLRAADAQAGVASEPGEFKTSATPIVREVKTSEITAAGAVLEAVVNPEGPAVKYHFEYGECPAGACLPGTPFDQSTPEGEIPAGSTNVSITQPISGLISRRTYHFRIDVNGEASFSPEGVFALEPAAPTCSSSRSPIDSGLPDCRAYEMVTPPGKNGALINNGAFLQQPDVSDDGSRVLMQSIQCFGGPSSCTAIRQLEGTTYSFERTPSGWTAVPLAPPISSGASILTYNANTQDVWYASLGPGAGFESLWARNPDGSVRDLGRLTEANGPQIGRISAAPFIASSDLSRVVFQGTELWPSVEEGSTGAQLWTYPSTTTGRPELVGVSGGAGSTSLISVCGTTLGGNNQPHDLYGSLSDDGQAIFFAAAECAKGTGNNAATSVPASTLYERVNGDSTVLVSGAGAAAECNAACVKGHEQHPADASFEGASGDGSDVYFTDTGRLTNEANQDNHQGDSAFVNCTATSPLSSGCNLYEFVCPEHCQSGAKHKLVDVSAGDKSGLGPQVQGVIAIPPDGSDVYFVAHGDLTGANTAGAEPVAGLDNLYVYRSAPGGSGHLSFITALSPSDEAMWRKQGGIGVANVTPDGRYLVFTSHRALTPDATRHEVPGQPPPPSQVYRYDAQTESMARISIGENGFNNNGNAGKADARIVAAFTSFGNGDGPGSSNPTVSEDGSLVFFESPTGLTPDALNDATVIGNPAVLAQNVYEWEAFGTQPSVSSPACANPAGCVSLISDGRDRLEGTDQHENESAVELLGTDESGTNVFFWTADPVLKRDTDSQVDLYDTRVDGGFEEP